MGEEADDGDEEGVRVWLVERDYEHEAMVRLVYATPEGDRHLTRNLSQHLLSKSPATAGRTVDPDRLEPVPEGDRERYAREATRVAEAHDPDDRV